MNGGSSASIRSRNRASLVLIMPFAFSVRILRHSTLPCVTVDSVSSFQWGQVGGLTSCCPFPVDNALFSLEARRLKTLPTTMRLGCDLCGVAVSSYLGLSFGLDILCWL